MALDLMTHPPAVKHDCINGHARCFAGVVRGRVDFARAQRRYDGLRHYVTAIHAQ
jgi:hypothetical protein